MIITLTLEKLEILTILILLPKVTLLAKFCLFLVEINPDKTLVTPIFLPKLQM